MIPKPTATGALNFAKKSYGEAVQKAKDFKSSSAEKGGRKEMTVAEEIESIKVNLSRLKEEKRLLVDPHGKLMQKWDFVIMLALLFTAIWTPYEVYS
jgi:predicted nuclease with TOPRIM domain